MSTYFEATNNNGKVIIDDTYRYLYEITTLNLNDATAGTPEYINAPLIHDGVAWAYVMEIAKLNSWYIIDSRGYFLDYSDYQTPIYIRVQVTEKGKLYGVRFKKTQSATPNCWVSVHQSSLGSVVSNSSGVSSIMIVIWVTNSNINLRTVLSDYVEIVEIGNDNKTMPACNSGMEVYNSKGEKIWNSNCKMLNVKRYYSGTYAGNFPPANENTKSILVPNQTYTQNGSRYGSHKYYYWTYKDFWTLGASGFINKILQQQSYYDRGLLWDCRDVAIQTDKYISGLILSSV